MTTSMIALLTKMVCVASMLGAVACTASTSKEPPPATTKSAVSAAATPTDGEEEGAADKVTCTVSAACDSDERCENGRCAGLDGDMD